jgi:hypothetical protein
MMHVMPNPAIKVGATLGPARFRTSAKELPGFKQIPINPKSTTMPTASKSRRWPSDRESRPWLALRRRLRGIGRGYFQRPRSVVERIDIGIQLERVVGTFSQAT